MLTQNFLGSGDEHALQVKTNMMHSMKYVGNKLSKEARETMERLYQMLEKQELNNEILITQILPQDLKSELRVVDETELVQWIEGWLPQHISFRFNEAFSAFKKTYRVSELLKRLGASMRVCLFSRTCRPGSRFMCSWQRERPSLRTRFTQRS